MSFNARPAYCTVAGVSPNRIVTGLFRAVWSVASTPAPVSGVTGPNPMPVSMTMSPGTAGWVFTPSVMPAGAAYTGLDGSLDANRAPAYCPLLVLRFAGAITAGARFAVVIAYGLVWPCAFVNTTG